MGAYGTSSSAGAAYVFGRNKNGSGAWGQVQSFFGAARSEQFGNAVAVNGDTLVIGANGLGSAGQKAYLYEYTGAGGWTSYAILSRPVAVNYGAAVAVYGDTVIVGDSGSNGNAGAAYLYSRNQGGAETWGIVSTLFDPTGVSNDDFGASVAVNGSTAVVGAPGIQGSQGKAYVYGNQAGGWASTATLNDPSASNSDYFGGAVAVSGDAIVVGAPYHAVNGTNIAGAAYVFNRNQGGSNAWGLIATQTDPSPAALDGYGLAVAVDGETVAIGTNQKDTAYLVSIQQPTAAKDASIVWYNSGQTVLWNMNGATIASAPSLGTGPAGWSIVGTADFNGDGSPDVLWRNTSGAVVIWFTNGSTVTSALNLGTVPTSWTVAGTGDFNGDGSSDILWRNSNGDTVIWYMSGTGIASSADLSTVPTTWTIAGTGDFDGDGNADILWRNSNGDTVIWFIKGGAINSSADLGVIPLAWSIAGAGDFNGDGHRDILWRNTNGDVVIWFMNGGTISSSSDLGVVASAWSINGVGDFNGDGKDDILWRNSNGDTLIWFMNAGSIASTGDLGVVASGWSIVGVSGN